MIPAKGTPEYNLWLTAFNVAKSAPLTHSPTTTHALIYWPRIEALREALEACGIDWTPAK